MSVQDPNQIPEKGSHIVISNGLMVGFAPNFEGVFENYETAKEHVDDELEQYPGLHYFICPIAEFHHATLTRHMRKMQSED